MAKCRRFYTAWVDCGPCAVGHDRPYDRLDPALPHGGLWGSDENLWSPTFALLLGRTVQDLAMFGHLPEVVLSLAGDLRLASFMTAEGDPAWTLFDRRGPHPLAIGCRPGVVCVEPEDCKG